MGDARDGAWSIVHLFRRGWQALIGLSSVARRRLCSVGPAANQGDDPASGVADPPDGRALQLRVGKPSGTDLTWRSDRPETTDGYAAVRNGQVEITPPTGGGLLPVLIPTREVVLTIDGHEVKAPISVWAGQRITVEPRHPSEPVRQYQITVGPDRMAAWLTMSPLGSPGFRILDAGPAHVIKLEAEALPGDQANPTPEEIERELAAVGVVAGIDRLAIARALEVKGAVKVRVAAGEPVRPSQPGRLEAVLQLPTAADPRPLSERVQPGQIMARSIPPQAGQAGYDVTGRILEPEPVRSVRLMAGAGAVMTSGGTEAVAAIAGRPSLLEVEPDVFEASVVPVTELRTPLAGDREGYQFEGDVVIRGDLQEGSHIQASGWIWVQGSVQGSILEAGQGIRVEKTVQHSSLITRSGRRILSAVLQVHSMIAAELEQMRAYARQIIDHPRYAELSRSKSFGEVMLLLAQNRFRSLRQGIDHVRGLLTELGFLQTRVDLDAVLNMLEERIYGGNMTGVDDLAQLINGFAAATERAAVSLGTGGVEAPVHAHTILWSRVDADGEVIVFGAGAELTTVKARGRVQIPKLRNSDVTAQTAIEVGRVVSSETGRTVLAVAAGGEIRIELAVTPVLLRIDEWNHRLPSGTRGVRVQSDRHGRIRLTAGGPLHSGPPVVLPALANGSCSPSEGR